MIKSKVIISMIFSVLLTILLVVGTVIATKDNSLVQGNLTTHGKLGAGMIAVFLLVWLWTLSVVMPMILKWKNTSPLLKVIIYSTLFMFGITLFIGIPYLVTKKDKEENIKIKSKKEVEE